MQMQLTVVGHLAVLRTTECAASSSTPKTCGELVPEWSDFVVGIVDTETCDELMPVRLNSVMGVDGSEGLRRAQGVVDPEDLRRARA